LTPVSGRAGIGAKKQPYYVTLRDGGPFAFAGLLLHLWQGFFQAADHVLAAGARLRGSVR
jgi:putative SOS response-associated peptidase YedK